jgi:hypothetical protein
VVEGYVWMFFIVVIVGTVKRFRPA